MEDEVFTKVGEKHVISSAGFEVKWEDAVMYTEPPRRIGFQVEGYWGDHGERKYDILMPAEPKWWPPYHTEKLSPDHLALIKANLVSALHFLYPGVPFDFPGNSTE